MDGELTPELLPAIDAFARVARHGSFTRAATELGVSPSALSQNVRNLERRLSVRLLNRTTRSVGLTEAGQAFLVRVRPGLELIGAAVNQAIDSRERPSGKLRINLPQIAAQSLIVPLLGEFHRRYPDIELELIVNNNFVDLIAGGFDAGIRLGEHLAADVIAVRAGPPLRLAVVGSPDYFARHPPPRVPADLHHHACLRYRLGNGGIYRWEFERNGQPLEIDVSGPVISNDGDLQLRIAIQGIGLAHLLEDHAREAIANGSLIRVLEDWCPPFPGFYLYYPAFSGSRAQMPLKLRVFIDFLQARLAGSPSA